MSKARLVVTAVLVEGRPKSEVARAYGMSRGWVRELVRRFEAEGEAGLVPRSRRPHTSPTQIPPEVEDEIVRFRKQLADAWLDAGAEPGLLPEARQVHQPHPIGVLQPRRPLAALARRAPHEGADVDLHRSARPALDHAQDLEWAESHQQLAHPDRVTFHRGPCDAGFDTQSLAGPLCYAPGPRPAPTSTPLISEAPLFSDLRSHMSE